MASSAQHRELRVPSRTQVSYELLSQLVTNHVREQADLDFKRTLYHPKNEKEKEELIKDVCAMANSGGGWIICGIAEENSAAADIIGVNLDVTDETKVHQMLEGRIDPPISVDIRVYHDQIAQKNLVAIHVPNSPAMPHLVKIAGDNKTRTFKVPIRKGPGTVWLDERRIRDLYRQSFNLVEEETAKNDQQLLKLAEQASEEFPGVALILLLTPQEPLATKLEKQQVQVALSNVKLDRFATSQGFSFLENLYHVLEVRDRRYVSRQKINRLHAFLEVGFDASVAVLIQLAVSEETSESQGSRLYTTEADEAAQNVVELALIEAYNCASQLAQQLNPVSDSQIKIQLIGHKNDPIYICKNEGSWAGSLLRPRDESAPIKHFRTVQHELEANPLTAQEHETLTELILETLSQAGIETLRVLQPLAESDDTP